MTEKSKEYEQAWDALDNGGSGGVSEETPAPVVPAEEAQDGQPTESETPPSDPPEGDAPGDQTPDNGEFAAYRQNLADLQTELASTTKALRDTQSWGRGMSQRLSELQKTVKESRLKGQRPALLDDMEGLEQAIEHVLTRQEPETELPPIPEWQADNGQPEKVADKSWEAQISEAIPDLEALLSDPELMQKAQAVKARAGQSWKNASVAIAHLSAIRERHLMSRENRDSRRLNGMSIPTGGNGSRPKTVPSSDDEVRSIWSESPEEFRKRKARTMGLM